MNDAIQRFETELTARIAQVVVAPEGVVRRLTIALILRGHVLLEGVPGVGKTLLAKTLAQSLGVRFQRIQGTADLMPADITGVHVYRSGSQQFELIPGPVFADVLLVDEINRASPKTQSALLEAMEERQVTIDRNRYRLPPDFFVIAAQNPHEFEGTFPLPESQLDRFLLKLAIGYPTPTAEAEILRRYGTGAGAHAIPAVEPLDPTLIAAARRAVDDCQAAPALLQYVIDLALATRRDARLSLGLSTRGALALLRCARAHAALEGRGYVLPDDVKALAMDVLTHRLVPSAEALVDGIDLAALVRQWLAEVPVPTLETA